jgi:AmiR/NasT family two-component response regulator
MDKHGLSEADSFAFIQKTAMNERRSMKTVAEEVVGGQLTPPV